MFMCICWVRCDQDNIYIIYNIAFESTFKMIYLKIEYTCYGCGRFLETKVTYYFVKEHSIINLLFFFQNANDI